MRKYTQNNMVKNKRYLTTKQASQYLNLHIRTMQSLSRQGKIKCFRIGKRWMYLREDIEKYGARYGTKEESSFMTANQVNAYLCIPLSTIYRLTKQYKIKAFKIGGSWRYLREDIEKYWLSNTNFSKESRRKLDNLVERSDRRSYPRINSNFDCHYSINLIPFKKIKSNGIIKDLSASGVFLFNKEVGQIDINDPVELEFVLVTDNNQKLDIKIKGRVVRKVESGVGIKFKSIDGKLQNRIIEYVG